MNNSRAGFTLIELLIVVGIIGVLAAAFLPDLLAGQETAYIAADSKNLSQHYAWQEIYRQRHNRPPTEGGHKFLIDVWVKEVCEPTPENLAKFFTPGIREQDAHYNELAQALARGEKIWPDLRSVSSMDTHYAARAKDHIKGMTSGMEAWAADDNEGDWSFKQSCTTNVLYGNGSVRSLTLESLKENFQWPGKEQVLKTYGPDAGHPDLRKLDN